MKKLLTFLLLIPVFASSQGIIQGKEFRFVPKTRPTFLSYPSDSSILMVDRSTGKMYRTHVTGGGGGSYTFSTPLLLTGSNVTINGLSGYGSSGQLIQSTGSALQYFTPTYVSTRDRLGFSGEDTRATAARIFSGANAHNFTFDSLMFIVKGILNTGNTITAYNGSQLFFNPRKAAFRAGLSVTGNWDESNVGYFSASFGSATATSNYTFATGQGSASAANATALSAGSASGSHALATGTGTASGGYSTALNSAVASNFYSLAAVQGKATAINSVSIGVETYAKDYGGAVFGLYNDSTSGPNINDYDVNNRAFQIGIGQNQPGRKNGFELYFSGRNRLPQYGIKTFTGTSTYGLAVDASGNIIEENHYFAAGEGISITAPNDTTTTITLKYDTCALASFGAGAGLSTDTAAFQTTSIYGSFYNDGSDTLIVTKLKIGLQGSSPSITADVFWNDSLNVSAGATKLVTAGTAATNIYEGTTVTSFDNTKIPPGNWIWVKTSSLSTKPTYFSLSLIGYKKRVNP